MSYCGEVSEDDWCREHATMKNYCRWQHEESSEAFRLRTNPPRHARALGGIEWSKSPGTPRRAR